MKTNCKKIFLLHPLLWLWVAMLMLTGCQTQSDPYASYRQFDAQTLVERSNQQLANHQWDKAVETLEALEILYPFGPHAEQTQLNLLYAYYQKRDMGAVAATADRYRKLYPHSQSMAYVTYLKALANYNHDQPLLSKLFRQDRAHRDLTLIEQAFRDFKTIAEQYPHSPYAEQARSHMVYLLDTLARAEYYAADYYYRRGAHVASANRAVYIVDNYPQSTETAKALALMVKNYRQLQLQDKAEDALRVLQLNYPDSAELAEVIASDTAPTANQAMTTASKQSQVATSKPARRRRSSWFG